MTEFPFPQFIQFYPTLRCNQQCFFCFNAGIPKSRLQREISFDQALRLVRICRSHGIREIDVMGGEPLLLDWMPDFAREAVAEGLQVNISTNGSNPGLIHRFAGLPPGMINIGVSLEGGSAGRHHERTRSVHFDSVLRTVASIAEAGIGPIVKSVVTRSTAADIQSIVDRVRLLGVRRYFLIHADAMTRDITVMEDCPGYSSFRDFVDRIQRASTDMAIEPVAASCFTRHRLPAGVRCAGGVRKLAVLPDGSLYPCNLLFHFPDMRLGNLFEDDLRVIWEDPRLSVFRTNECCGCTENSCPNLQHCTGGCPAHNLLHAGSFSGRDVRCRAAMSDAL